jgi:sulfur-oxidizing protein SoxY
MRRRAFLAGGAALALSRLAGADDDPGNGWRQTIARLTGGRTPQQGRVQLELPRIADNGNSVALAVSVDGPMQGPERTLRVHLVSDLNPYAHMASFRFGPGTRRAAVATRVKLAGTQRVFAIAELADGSVWSDVREVSVAFSACFEGPA